MGGDFTVVGCQALSRMSPPLSVATLYDFFA